MPEIDALFKCPQGARDMGEKQANQENFPPASGGEQVEGGSLKQKNHWGGVACHQSGAPASISVTFSIPLCYISTPLRILAPVSAVVTSIGEGKWGLEISHPTPTSL